jgi:hypothetical protein
MAMVRLLLNTNRLTAYQKDKKKKKKKKKKKHAISHTE